MARRRRYPWPASRLDAELIHRAHLRQMATGERITSMVREGLIRYLAAADAPAIADPGLGINGVGIAAEQQACGMVVPSDSPESSDSTYAP